MLVRNSLRTFVAGLLLMGAARVDAQIVPGSGHELTELSDNFEDPNWLFNLNLPKASTNIDKVDRQPAGYSANGMWFESTYRGTPDYVKRVETPPGGIPGSTGAMAMQTMYSGVPGVLSNKFQQDDLIANVSQKLGFMIPAAWTPSYVVRVYLPPFEAWEQRNGSSFGFRADCQTMLEKPTKMGKFFRTGGTHKEMEQYWPGFFIQYNAKNHPQHPDQNTATILIRSGVRGEDIPGPTITQPGWWTLGMTITPDGKVHYYGHPGVANLTHRDHLYSNFPYGYKCLQTSTYFFNIVNQDDGRTWSTRWIVDDPKVYVATRPYTPQTAQAPVAAQPISQTRTVPAATTPAAAPATTPAVPATTNTTPVATPVAPPATQPASAQPAITPAVPPATQTLPIPLQTTPQPITPQPVLQTPAPKAPAVPLPAIQQPASPQPADPAPSGLPSLSTTPTPPATTLRLETKPSPIGIPPLQTAAVPIVPVPTNVPVITPGPFLIPEARTKLPALSSTATALPALSTAPHAPTTSQAPKTTLPSLSAVPVPVPGVPVTLTKTPEAGTATPPALLPEESANESAPLIAPVISTPAPAPMALPQDDAPMLPMTPPPSDPAVPPLLPPAPPTAE